MMDIKKQYPEIAAMTVAQIIESQEFENAFKKALNTFNPFATPQNYYAYRSLLKEGFFELEKFKKEYIACIDKQSKLPFAKRVVMFTVGNDAYQRTIKKMMKDYDEQSILHNTNDTQL